MASDYGRNFGFRRSDESLLVRDGRFRVPATGTFRQGSLVTIDPATPGFLKAAVANEIGEGATVGLLVQEEVWDRSIYENGLPVDSYYLGAVRNNRMAQIVAGSGGKIWLKNTAAETRADGRVIAAVTMVDLTTGTPAVKDYLAWNGTGFAKGTGPSDSMLRITAISGTTYCEAVLVR